MPCPQTKHGNRRPDIAWHGMCSNCITQLEHTNDGQLSIQHSSIHNNWLARRFKELFAWKPQDVNLWLLLCNPYETKFMTKLKNVYWSRKLAINEPSINLASFARFSIQKNVNLPVICEWSFTWSSLWKKNLKTLNLKNMVGKRIQTSMGRWIVSRNRENAMESL